MRRWLAILVTLAALVFAAGSKAQPGPAADRNQSARELSGRVVDRSDAPIGNAIVYLKNTKTLVVRTFITSGDGQYRFPALAQNVDYQVYAEHQGTRSDVKTLSSFDSRPQVSIKLKITGK